MLQHRKLFASMSSAPLRTTARLWGGIARGDSPQLHCHVRNIAHTCSVATPVKMEAVCGFRPVSAAHTSQLHAASFGFQLKHSTRIFGVAGSPRAMVISVELTETEFHNMANVILDEVQDQLEAQEDANPGLEVESSGDGVINIKIAGTGHWVINKQTPSRQIWFSSPVTGPTHYRWTGDAWVCTKDEHNMAHRFREQLNVNLP